MQILHISDLHFGAHNKQLKGSLERMVDRIRPDVIVVTGDLAERPDLEHLKEAHNYLHYDLERGCARPPAGDLLRPRILVVPGNHDTHQYKGTLIRRDQYDQVFGGMYTKHYYQPENVWIYGFDSSSTDKVAGANGKIDPDDLQEFIREYERLRKKDPRRFEAAFKIVALHHHPIPIKYDETVSQWLSLTNAAAFLNVMLNYRVDLIIHGHEHVRASVRYGRHLHLRADDYREIRIVSGGSALKKVTDPEAGPNCFHLIDITTYGTSAIVEDTKQPGFSTAQVFCYLAEGDTFNQTPLEPIVVRSPVSAAKHLFETDKNLGGYHFEDVSSITLINSDGDAKRIVECHDLITDRVGTKWAQGHDVRLPTTSGYLDLFRAMPIPGNGQSLPSRRITPAPRLKQDDQSASYRVDFGRVLGKDDKISYEYSWYTVNAFPLDTQQAIAKSKKEDWDRFEYTHLPVLDPIDALTIIVQFPQTPALRPNEFFPRVAPLHDVDQEDAVMTNELKEHKGLRYYDSLRSAALRITNPLPGYSYGIKWRVPPAPEVPQHRTYPLVEDLVRSLLRKQSLHRSGKMHNLLRVLADKLLREQLIPDSDEKLDVGLMVFDRDQHRMVMIADALMGKSLDAFSWQDCSAINFGYGEGIGGKIFKANNPRLYERLSGEAERNRTTPDFYLKILEANPRKPDPEPHKIFFGMPVQNPFLPSQVYGVMCCGSSSPQSHLWKVLEGEEHELLQKLKIIQGSLNELCLRLLRLEMRDDGGGKGMMEEFRSAPRRSVVTTDLPSSAPTREKIAEGYFGFNLPSSRTAQEDEEVKKLVQEATQQFLKLEQSDEDLRNH